jgi:hypothetical protein
MKLLYFDVNGRKHSVLLTSIDYISKRCDIFLCEHTITDVPFSKIKETVENYLKWNIKIFIIKTIKRA